MLREPRGKEVVNSLKKQNNYAQNGNSFPLCTPPCVHAKLRFVNRQLGQFVNEERTLRGVF